MSEIVLTTLNAKYIHAAFGLRYLLANMGELQPRTTLIEFDINQRALDIAEALLARRPRLVGIGVYIWNARLSLDVVRILKRLRPDLLIVLGGPEVSYESTAQEIVGFADYVVTGEADLKFPELCRNLLAGEMPPNKIIHSETPELGSVRMPYELYSDQDVRNRIIYVEASRGCAFTCEFCLSSLDVPVRQFPLDAFLTEMERLLDRGVLNFKFVDRTFNLNLNTSRALLQFFLDRYRPGLFLHFEMIPDRLPEGLRELLTKFPAGSLQFEVGIQSFNDEVCARIKRRQNYDRLSDNFRFLREKSGVHIHADLIAGLPGEDFESFGRGFNRLVDLKPQEIQVGILKRLRGTPIVRHDHEWQMLYSPEAPYEILATKDLTFPQIQLLRRFSRYWDLIGNSGNFVKTTPLIWSGTTPFQGFIELTEWLHPKAGTSGVALLRLTELIFEFLTQVRGLDPTLAAQAVWHDYRGPGRLDPPPFLKSHIPVDAESVKSRQAGGMKRQARHLASATPPLS